jgi:hypothetical protein
MELAEVEGKHSRAKETIRISRTKIKNLTGLMEET